MSDTPESDALELAFLKACCEGQKTAFDELMAKMREFEKEILFRDRTITALRERNKAMEESRDETRSQLADLHSEIHTIYLEGWDNCESCFDSSEAVMEDWTNSRSKRLSEGKESPVRRCGGCLNQIDPDCCCCGALLRGHDPMELGHSFVPMGCDCGRVKE